MILDFYDDPDGNVLKGIIPSHDNVPDFIKTAEHLGDRHDSLPDDVFALVMVDQGVKMRKYACVDKGNTALSVMYFIENHDRLPENAVKTAAVNLLAACDVHDIAPPLPLCELADDGYEKLAVGDTKRGLQKLLALRKRLQKREDRFFNYGGGMGDADYVGKALASSRRVHKAIAKSPHRELAGPPFSKTGGVGGVVKGLMGGGLAAGEISSGASAHNKMMAGVKKGVPAGQVKLSDVVGTEIMPQSVDKEMKEKTAASLEEDVFKTTVGARLGDTFKDFKRRRAIKRGLIGAGLVGTAATVGAVRGLKARKRRKALEAAKMKTASPYVDVTGQKPKVKIAKARYERYCLVKEGSSKFPIDSYDQVKTAVAWFSDYHESLDPEDRREYCIKLAARAAELTIPVTDQIEKYAAQTVAPEGQLKIAFGTRRQFWRTGDSEISLLEGLEQQGKKAGFEKNAEAAAVVCEALRQFDEVTGLNHHWDSEVYDPYYSIYGMEKQAEWSFSTHGDKITEKALRELASAGFAKIKEKMGDDIAEGLRKNPTQIFDSLPLDTKRIIMRMAGDPQPDPCKVMG